jgi:hypothetical protein
MMRVLVPLSKKPLIKDGDNDGMDVDVESEDDGSDKDAKDDVVHEEDNINIK